MTDEYGWVPETRPAAGYKIHLFKDCHHFTDSSKPLPARPDELKNPDDICKDCKRLAEKSGDDGMTGDHDESPISERASAFTDLARKLYLPPHSDFLNRVTRLLRQKRQIVFHGPPGTGKTFVAQKLAEHLAGSEGSVELVQFHPSYSYEDFVQGYRPAENGGFVLRDGPLLRAAKRATEAPEAKWPSG